jgi:NTE family protein/lysophospholipid hydrolase
MGDRNHMARLARMITDSGIGLVLSGGGARGFAHIGIFKAMKEMGLPIDMVCGTSIGSIIAAGIAIDYDLAHLLSQYRSAFVDEKPLSDYTLPVLSLIKGHKLQKVNRKYFKDYHIEDLWLNFFCVSSNYTTSELVIHDRGPVWKAVTASASIPGVLPPIVEGNHLLVDGGVVNNFPVDIMKSRYGGKLIGIDLKIEKEYKLNYDRLPGGWHLFFSRFLPFLRKYRTPGIATIMMKSTLLASAGHQRKMVEDLHLYLRPPVGNFGLLRLDEFDKIVQAGYTYARETLTPADLKSLVESPK